MKMKGIFSWAHGMLGTDFLKKNRIIKKNTKHWGVTIKDRCIKTTLEMKQSLLWSILHQSYV